MALVYFTIYYAEGPEAATDAHMARALSAKHFIENLVARGVSMEPTDDVARSRVWDSSAVIDRVHIDGKDYAIVSNTNLPYIGVYLEHYTDEEL
jgi:hypothetical protein